MDEGNLYVHDVGQCAVLERFKSIFIGNSGKLKVNLCGLVQPQHSHALNVDIQFGCSPPSIVEIKNVDIISS